MKKTGGEIIRELRVNKGLTIKEVAEKVGLHYVFFSRLERDLEKPSEETIKKIAEILNYNDDVNVLITAFGRIPKNIEKVILDDPELINQLPQFYKKIKRKGANNK